MRSAHQKLHIIDGVMGAIEGIPINVTVVESCLITNLLLTPDF